VSKWVLVALLVIQAHFAASYLVPLDERSQGAFGGLLRWAWPWSEGDHGPLGQVSVAHGPPSAGLFLAMAAGGLLLLAALAVAGLWAPVAWWRALAVLGTGLLVCLMALFLSPTKVLPMAVGLATAYVALRAPTIFAVG